MWFPDPRGKTFEDDGDVSDEGEGGPGPVCSVRATEYCLGGAHYTKDRTPRSAAKEQP